MAHKAGTAFVLGQACLCYNLLPDEPDDGEAVWHLAHDDGATQVYQLTKPRGMLMSFFAQGCAQLVDSTKPTGNWVGPQRKVICEYTYGAQRYPDIGDKRYGKRVVCYIGSQPGVKQDTWTRAFDHIEATASRNKPIRLFIDFEDPCSLDHHYTQLEKRGFDFDWYDDYDEESEELMSKLLA